MSNRGVVRKRRKPSIKGEPPSVAYQVLARDAYNYIQDELEAALKVKGNPEEIAKLLRALAASKKVLDECGSAESPSAPPEKGAGGRYDMSDLGA